LYPKGYKLQAQSKSSGEAAYDALLTSIREGHFAPGDRLREEDVALRLSLSRTPVREALRRLETDGIVEHRPRIGAVIRKLSHAEVVELYEMRIVLERTAAELAAKHGSDAEFDALEGWNNEIARERQNPAKAAEINQRFHRGIYLAGRNRFLIASARGLNNSLLLLGPTTFTDDARIDVVVAQHQDIVDALRGGDSKAAGEAAAIHLETSLRHRLRAMQL
jgi:DNA-binding GntR family transcriptional regulator